MTATYQIECSTKGFCDIHDITEALRSRLAEAGLRDGVAVVFVPGSTAAITTIEFENGVVNDLRRAIEELVPQDRTYQHDARWGDGNGFAHVRASLLGPSLSIPVGDGRLQLGTWQQVILIDFDNRSRDRRVVVQFVGE